MLGKERVHDVTMTFKAGTELEPGKKRNGE